MYPKIVIDIKKLKQNIKIIVERCKKYDINVSFVVKVFLADPVLVKATVVDSEIKSIADSRIKNLKRIKNIDIEKWLIRIPMKSEISDLVKYCDVSLNSDISTIKAINEECARNNKIHKIILMIDLGDLREGYFDLDELYSDIEEILNLDNVIIHGIGTNLTCYGGVIPRPETLSKLVDIKKNIEKKFNINLEVVSGGNSSSYTLIDSGEMIADINNLRLGEVIVLGTESSYGNKIKDLNYDVFTLEAEIVEIKEKPSIPIGEIGMDSFGNTPIIKDKGILKRAILAIGKQDVNINKIFPIDENIEILGGSSDHLIINITDSKINYKVGDKIKFNLCYESVLNLMTSEFVFKEYVLNQKK